MIPQVIQTDGKVLVTPIPVDFFYSDPHFGHKNIIEFCKRPFADLPDMHEQMIKLYNKRVSPDQTVLWCGDAFFCNLGKAQSILQHLNGKKIIVRGNHDGKADRLLTTGFDVVAEDHCVVLTDKGRIRARHYPYAGVQRFGDDRYFDRMSAYYPGEYLVHGHTHDAERKPIDGQGGIHVGVDAWGYAPASAEEVLALI